MRLPSSGMTTRGKEALVLKSERKPWPGLPHETFTQLIVQGREGNQRQENNVVAKRKNANQHFLDVQVGCKM